MKPIRLLLLTCITLWLFPAQAQVPQKINYQALARSNQALYANQTLDVRFTVLPLGGSVPLYQEFHLNVPTDDYGLFQLQLGEGVPLIGTFSQLDWSAPNQVQTELRPAGTTTWDTLSVQAFHSVPYSLQAARSTLADSVVNLNLASLQDVDTTGIGAGQVLAWDVPTQTWRPQPASGASYIAGIGIDITGPIISNTGDLDPSDDIMLGTVASGDLGGTFPSPLVRRIQGHAVDATPPAVGEILQWDGLKWTPSSPAGGSYVAGPGIDISGSVISNTGDRDSTDDITNTTPAGGDLGNFFPSPIVVGLQGNPLSPNFPAVGEILQWDGSQWIPSSPAVLNYTAGSGIDISGSVISNTGDLDSTDDITNTTPAGGDLSGTYPNPTVVALQGNPISPISPIDGQILKWSAATGSWLATDDTATLGDTLTLANGSGNRRVELGISNDEGFVHIFDGAGALRAGLRINASGQGEVFGDVKNFRIPHPEQADQEIWYASLEGPEAAAYLRGTTRLVDGRAEVRFPDHFRLIAAEAGMTVLLTPLSGSSKGLAVIAKEAAGFSVVELLDGKGDYEFDWEVKCVRRGHESFEIIRPRH